MVHKRSLVSWLCLSTSICSFHHCYLCLPGLHENHLYCFSRPLKLEVHVRYWTTGVFKVPGLVFAYTACEISRCPQGLCPWSGDTTRSMAMELVHRAGPWTGALCFVYVRHSLTEPKLPSKSWQYKSLGYSPDCCIVSDTLTSSDF